MNSPAITKLTLEEAPQRLWHEWLSGYFDGGTHPVGGSGVAFPTAELAFEQSALSQPLSSVGITVVGDAAFGKRYGAAQGEIAWDEVTWTFYIRAAETNTVAGQGNAKYRARQATQLLRGLIEDDEAVRPLGQKGIHHLRVIGSNTVPGTDYAVRSLRVRGEVHYEI